MNTLFHSLRKIGQGRHGNDSEAKPEESLPELSHRVEEHYNFKKHIIEWESAETADSEKPVYTLVAINEDNRLFQ